MSSISDGIESATQRHTARAHAHTHACVHACVRTELHVHIEGKRIAGAVCMASVQLETAGHFRSKMISEPTAERCVQDRKHFIIRASTHLAPLPPTTFFF